MYILAGELLHPPYSSPSFVIILFLNSLLQLAFSSILHLFDPHPTYIPDDQHGSTKSAVPNHTDQTGNMHESG